MSQSSYYPISQLITRLMQEHGYSGVEFVKALGYRNLERGLRRLDPWLDQGEGYERILKQIATTYPVADELAQAVAATKEIKTAEYEAEWIERCKAESETFRPFVHAVGERTVPSQICIFGISGGHRRWTTIEIPQKILDMPVDEQLAALPDLMREYLEKYEGACPFFGKVTGFRFVRLVDYFQFDKDGMFVEHVDKPFRTGYVSVSFR